MRLAETGDVWFENAVVLCVDVETYLDGSCSPAMRWVQRSVRLSTGAAVVITPRREATPA